jgi:hypothetical protein
MLQTVSFANPKIFRLFHLAIDNFDKEDNIIKAVIEIIGIPNQENNEIFLGEEIVFNLFACDLE